ncbi:pilus assembly protein [Pseudomonas fluorescens]|uniref:Pilus assembly protein n=1 Tax=Pseudomonas fluorescens TaxID=294 RepID=A0AAE2Q467_PSEFL|nr:MULTISPECIES: TadE/TadG family type IV pilus assembly protein [Pseudomonas fluorescens group]MBA1429467.1 pilus assembly protein [Pseudomonas orientalis]MBD8151106.1 pilus assembly protein [Pseudomonas fluorescens]MBD8178826.1 pilus assembly protein [Pseudomonas fluorescens]MBD8273284.1 pilus assembly protein [Pseudomonas fluorescens]MBD8748472.1 pilus assembly protein [Pseudomonas fluorescens]
MKTSLPRKQKGTAAIEFAAVFVIFFAVFYGMVSYSLPLLLLQSFNQATAEAVRLSVGLDPAMQGYSTAVQTTAKNAISERLSWLPDAYKFNAATQVSTTFVDGLLNVKISYPSANLHAVMPFIVLPGIGSVPQLPATLQAQSSLQF